MFHDVPIQLPPYLVAHTLAVTDKMLSVRTG